MNLPSNLVRNSFLMAIGAVIVYILAMVWIGWADIRENLAAFPPVYLLGMASLSLLNYGLRYWRWELFLKRARCPLPRRSSLGLYFSSYVMVITPGKVGEVFKAALMRENHGHALARGLPVVLAERICDFLAVLILAGLGFLSWEHSNSGIMGGLVVAAALCVILLLLRDQNIRTKILTRMSRAPLLKDHQLAMAQSSDTLGELLGSKTLIIALASSTLAWLAECLGLWLACRGLGYSLSLPEATFTYAAATLVGSLSFLPGGLGGTEATLIYLLKTLKLSSAGSAAVALVVRLFTLWLAVAIGLVFSVVFRKEFFLNRQ